MPYERCFYYTSDGQPIAYKMKHHPASCRFIHPHDREWASLPHRKQGPRDYSSPRPARSRSPSQHRRSLVDSPKDSLMPDIATIAPPPAIPPSLSAAAHPPPLANTDDLRVEWDKVFSVFSTCISAREAYNKALDELQEHERMLRTPRFKALSPADKERISLHQKSLNETKANAEALFSERMAALKTLDWWAVKGPQHGTEKLDQLVKLAKELNDTMSRKLTDESTQADSDSNTRPLKRRRLSQDELPDMDDDRLRKVMARVTDLEGRTWQLEGDLASHQEYIVESVVEELNSQLGKSSISEGAAASTLALITEMTQLSNNVTRLNQELADERAQRAQVEARFLQHEQEKRQLVKVMEEMQQRIDSLQGAQNRDAEEFEAITKGFEALALQPPAPVPMLPLETLVMLLKAPIKETVYSTVKPIVDEMIKELEAKISQHDAETYAKLWSKIALTLKVVEAAKRNTVDT